MTIAFLTMLSNVDLRPQSLALISFAALLAVARSDRSFKTKLIIVAPLLVAWQNMHPSVAVGALALAGLAASDFLESRRTWAGTWQLLFLTLLAVGAQFSTPLQTGVISVSRNNLRISRDVLHLAEWGPPWDPKVVAAVSPYWIALAGSLAAIVWLHRHLSPRTAPFFLVMTGLSLYAARFIIFWAVALVPFWAQVVERLLPNGMFASARNLTEQRVGTARAILGLVAGSAIVLGVHAARKAPIIEPEIPLDGVRTLRESCRLRQEFTTITSGPAL